MDIGSTLKMLDKIKKIIKDIDRYAYLWLPALLLIIVFYPVSILGILITIVLVCIRHILESDRQKDEQNEI